MTWRSGEADAEWDCSLGSGFSERSTVIRAEYGSTGRDSITLLHSSLGRRELGSVCSWKDLSERPDRLQKLGLQVFFFFLEERCARVSLGVLSVLSVRLDFTSVPLKDSKANVLASQPIKSKLL